MRGYAVVMEWDPEFSKEDTFGDSEEESDQVVSDSEMAEEIEKDLDKTEVAKMYDIDESPLHVREKEVEPVKKRRTISRSGTRSERRTGH